MKHSQDHRAGILTNGIRPLFRVVSVTMNQSIKLKHGYRVRARLKPSTSPFNNAKTRHVVVQKRIVIRQVSAFGPTLEAPAQWRQSRYAERGCRPIMHMGWLHAHRHPSLCFTDVKFCFLHRQLARINRNCTNHQRSE